jgi:hypothetical protein
MGINKYFSGRSSIVAGSVLGCCGIAATCVALAASSPASSALPSTKSGGSVTVAPALVRDLSVLGTTEGGLPAWAQARLSVPGGTAEEEGLNLGAARSSEVDGLTVSIIPGESNACAYIRPTGETPSWWGTSYPVGVCASTAETITGGLRLWHGGGSKLTVVGVVPDGYSSVRITGSNGSAMTVPVVNNAYVARLEDPALQSATALELQGPEGRVEHIETEHG